jgi:hypothetical protein
MSFSALLHTFAHDDKIRALIVLIFADFVFGVGAALKVGNFRLSFVADLLKKDVLQKVVPYFVLYSIALVAGGYQIVVPGIDFGVVAGAAYVVLVAALASSVFASLKTLGVPIAKVLPDHLAGPEPGAKP